MMNLSRWKVIAVVLSAIFGVLFTLPNVLPADVRDSLPGFMPKQTLNLGLDLQGVGLVGAEEFVVDPLEIAECIDLV